MLITFMRRAWISGSMASLVSTAALLAAGARDCSSSFAPVNAVSHWVWKRRAFHQYRPSFKYTVVGYLIHHMASVFWAVAYEAVSVTGKQRLGTRTRTPALLVNACTVSALAAAVDLKCTPERLTPGFERKLKPVPLTGVYIAFGAGLVLGSLLMRR